MTSILDKFEIKNQLTWRKKGVIEGRKGRIRKNYNRIEFIEEKNK